MKAQLKDYYKILEVQPAALLPEIKKAYRRLAFKYHPDTNAGQFAEIRFREIQEAYEVLGHTEKRRHYDEERWLAGMGNRARDKELVTPQWILKEAQRLTRHMATVDTYRMSHSALHDYIFLLLSDAHMAILQEDGDHDTNRQIVLEILTSTPNLRHLYMQPVGDRLAILATPDNELLSRIYQQVNQSRRSAAWEKYMPLVIVLVAILLAVVMWWWGR